MIVQEQALRAANDKLQELEARIAESEQRGQGQGSSGGGGGNPAADIFSQCALVALLSAVLLLNTYRKNCCSVIYCPIAEQDND